MKGGSLVNSASILTQEKPPTSSVELDKIQPYRMPHVPMWYFQDLGMTSLKWWAPEAYVYHATAPGIDTLGFYWRIAGTAPETRVLFHNRASVETLLGGKGRRLLEKLLALIEDTSRKRDWPIIRVEVSQVEDVEVRDWQYILLTLVFGSDFDSADRCLHDFYEELDLLSDTLEQDEQDILRRMLFFDAATAL